MSATLSIGGLAAMAGVTVETIRFYQRRGLIAEPQKPPGGHRRYSPVLAQRVRFIKRAQVLGFTLDEIAGLLRLDERLACGETRELAARKLRLIERKLAELAAMRAALTALIGQCDAVDRSAACPIIHTLAAD